jgi:uncharacterized protein RhaS with RHS repeats
MTEESIVSEYIRMVFKDKNSTKIFPNIFIDRFECDLLELTKSGYLYEYEVKISKSDFKADANKKTYKTTKYNEIKSGNRVNYFYYIVPENLIQISDLPEFAGLVYAKKISVRYYSDDRGYYNEDRIRFETIKNAPKLSVNKISEKRASKLLDSIYYRFHSYRIKLKELKPV